jgi:hypothetical protein
MSTHKDLNGLRELAAQRSASMATPRLLELAAELSLLEQCMEFNGALNREIAEAKFRHAATNEAGAWDFAFVRRLMAMGLCQLGMSAMTRIPAHVLIPVLSGPDTTRRAALESVVCERDEARKKLEVLAHYIADQGNPFRVPDHVAEIVRSVTEG